MLVTTGQSGVDVADFTLTGAFTVESWIYFEPGQSISNSDGLLRTEDGGAHVNFYDGQMRFASYVSGEPRGDVVTGGTVLGTGQWHHVAISRDANDILRVYVDGQLDGTATEAWTADLVVDQITQTKRGVTHGAFDEMRFWDRELTEAEISASMAVTVDPSSADLLRYYRFDDTVQILDETGNSGPLAVPTGATLAPSDSPVAAGGNARPVGTDDTASTDPGQAVSIDVLGNDSDDGALNPATVTIVDGPGNGGAVAQAGGNITYTPDGGFQGTDTFTYTVADDEGSVSNPTTVTVTVGTPNDAPVAANDTASTDPDQAILIDVLNNDSDDGTLVPGSVNVLTGPVNGSTNVLPNGNINYTPDAGFQGTDTFTYQVADDLGALSDPATVTVNVGNAPAGMYKTNGEQGVDVDNFTLSGAFTVESWIYFEPGESISNRDGFLRAAGGDAHINFFNGQARFASYITGEPRGDVVSGSTVLGTGEWHHVAFSRDENNILRVYVDGQLDGTATEAWTADLVVDKITQTKRGVTDGAFDEMRFWSTELSQAEIAASMNVTVNPTSADLVRYYQFDDPTAIIDSTGNSNPIVTLPKGGSLIPSDSPLAGSGGGNTRPVGIDDSATTDPGQAVSIDVLSNDSDDGALDPLTVTIVDGPDNGGAVAQAGGNITYTPTGGFQGTDTFTYAVADTEGLVSLPTTVTVTVGSPNDAPVAANDSATTDPGQAVVINVLANDTDDGTLNSSSVAIIGVASNGTAVVQANGTVSYTPNDGFQGTDMFTYQVADDQGALSDPATVTVTVGSAPAGKYVTTAQQGIDVENFALTGAFTVESWIYFEPGQSISNRDGFLRAENGDAHINFYDGQARFAAYVSGEPRGDVVSGETVLGTGQWHHVAVSRDADDILRIYVDGQLDGTATEAWTADLVVDRITETKRGVTYGAFDEMRFWDTELTQAEIVASMDVTIDPNTAGLSRYYRFDDPALIIDETGNSSAVAIPTGGSVVASDSPVTTGGNSSPIAQDDIASNSAVNAPVNVDVLANDSDRDGTLDLNSVTIVGNASNGNAVVEADGSITYTPSAGFEGTDNVTYTVADNLGAISFPATISFSVGQGALNQPDSVDDSFDLIAYAQSVPLAVLMNDTDPTNDELGIGSFTQPTNGTVTLIDGVLHYTPDAGFSGTDTFTYRASDGLWESSEAATVTLEVSPSFKQPQNLIDSKIAPEITASGLTMVIEKVAQLPLNSTGGQPNMNTFATTGDRTFVGTEGDVDNQSNIYELVDDGQGGQQFELFMDIGAAIVAATGRNLSNANAKHGGLRSVDFHPEFDDPTSDGYGKFYTAVMEERPANTNGHTYLSDVTNPINADGVLLEWTYDHSQGEVDLGSYREVFRVGMPVFDHAIRQIGFDPNAEPGDENYGLLYVGHGDGSIQSAAQGGGQNNDALGKILRIDPLQDGANSYSVPSTNPFVGDPNMIDEAFALGFRNPAHLGFAKDADGVSQLIVTTIGRDNFDEVNIVEAGENYGWGEREGPLVHVGVGGGINNGVLPLPADDADYGYTYPTTFIGHGGPIGAGFVGRALTGGYVIQNGSSEFDDEFIFAEFATTGRVFHASLSEMLDAVTKLDPNDPTRDDPSELSWVTPKEVTILFDHDNDDSTTALVRNSLKDIFDDNPDFEVSISKGLTRADVRFGQGADGELYVMNKHDGWLYLVENTVAPDDLLV